MARYRAGFVSNSSSSSFLIALPEGKDGMELPEWVSNDVEDETSLHTEEDVLNYLTYCFGHTEVGIKEAMKVHSWIRYSYDEYMTIIDEGDSVLILDVDNHRQDTVVFLREHPFMIEERYR